MVDGSAMPAVPVAGDGGRGVGLDVEQNVWTVNNSGSVVVTTTAFPTAAAWMASTRSEALRSLSMIPTDH